MRVQIDCYPCILAQLSELAKKATGDRDGQHRLVKEMMRLVLTADDATTPPEFAGCFHRLVAEVSGIEDPFREIKDKSTELGLALLPELRKLAAGEFDTALRLAVGGNIIDYGVNPDFELAEAEKAIREVLDLPYDRAAAADLKRRMDEAESIFYMLDNCGEAVLDRLLLERYAGKLTIGVRGRPILNDVTRREAALSGINFARIVDTGDMAPGISLRNSSPDFLKELGNADLVVSKGQGNFESLDEAFRRPIYFLLRVKCRVVAERLDAPLGSIQIIGRNLDA